MTSITETELKFEAAKRGYRPEILEKVYRLLDLLEVFMGVPFLKDRLVLKGGTAINLFFQNELPRLSLDIDFNYIGSSEREIMLKDKPQIDRVIRGLCESMQYKIDRNPQGHAGGKMVLIYQSVMSNKAQLELDINYLYRNPLWPVEFRYSTDWPKKVGTHVLDVYELAAGKLHALLERHAARDIFDSHRLLTEWNLDTEKLRKAFAVYAGMRQQDWKTMTIEQVNFDVEDIRNKLIPVLKKSESPGTNFKEITEWANRLVFECREQLQKLLPFNDPEIAFLEALDAGNIRPEFISNDEAFCMAVRGHPLLKWKIQKKTQNV